MVEAFEVWARALTSLHWSDWEVEPGRDVQERVPLSCDQGVQVPHVHVEGRRDDLCHMDLFTEGIKIPEHLDHAWWLFMSRSSGAINTHTECSSALKTSEHVRLIQLPHVYLKKSLLLCFTAGFRRNQVFNLVFHCCRHDGTDSVTRQCDAATRTLMTSPSDVGRVIDDENGSMEAEQAARAEAAGAEFRLELVVCHFDDELVEKLGLCWEV